MVIAVTTEARQLHTVTGIASAKVTGILPLLPLRDRCTGKITTTATTTPTTTASGHRHRRRRHPAHRRRCRHHPHRDHVGGDGNADMRRSTTVLVETMMTSCTASTDSSEQKSKLPNGKQGVNDRKEAAGSKNVVFSS